MSRRRKTVTTKTATMPEGTRVYAVGDIHGRADLLVELLDLVDEDMRRSGAGVGDGHIVFLGDVIDRGPDSHGVVERLTQPMPAGLRPTYIRGNHEDRMLGFLACYGQRDNPHDRWYSPRMGGPTTVYSYLAARKPEVLADGSDEPYCLGGRDLFEVFNQITPPSHKAFFDGLVISATIGDYCFVHAGVNPHKPLADQEPEDCMRIREPFLSHAKPLEKVIVHGHVAGDDPVMTVNRICVDTRAVYSGKLTAVVLEGNTRRFLQTRIPARTAYS